MIEDKGKEARLLSAGMCSCVIWQMFIDVWRNVLLPSPGLKSKPCTKKKMMLHKEKLEP
jgi:hypothetical protein